MLLQSINGAVHLLPALPDAEPQEVLQRTLMEGFVVDMNWNGVQLDKAKGVIPIGNHCVYVRVPCVGWIKRNKGRIQNEYYEAEIETFGCQEINPQYPAFV